MLEGTFVGLANIARMRINIDVLMSHLINDRLMEDYQCWNKHGEEGFNEIEMRNSYLEREVPTSVEEEHNDVNEADILGLLDDDIVF
jgi:hypothetical protein